MNANELVENLLKLQSLDSGEVRDEETEKRIAELRRKVPEQILGHYDRLRVRGKTGVAAIRNQVCTGCHVQVPKATVILLMHQEDLQVCDNCGRYLHLPEKTVAAAPVVTATVVATPAAAIRATRPARKRAAKPAKASKPAELAQAV